MVLLDMLHHTMQAVQHGHWLVLENVDAAPPEVMAALGQLCDAGVLHIPQRAQAIPTAPGFQLLATLSTPSNGAGHAQHDAMEGAWVQVALTPPGPADVAAIVEHAYAPLTPLLPSMLRCCGAVQMAVGCTDAQWADARCDLGCPSVLLWLCA